jgi:hypothetical protein
MYGAPDYDLTNGVNMGLAGASSTKIINENTYLKTTIGVTGHKNMVITDSLSEDRSTKYPNYRSNFVENVLNASSFLNKKLNNHHLIKTGIDYKHLIFNYNDSVYHIHDNNMEAIRSSSGNTDLWQPWLQWQYRVTDELDFSVGLHLSHFNLTGESIIEPRAAVSWKFRPNQSLSLGYGLHSQTAPLYLYFSQVKNEQGNITTPNSALPMMKSRHVVLSYDRALGENTRMKLETYYQHLFDVAVDKTRETPYSLLNEGANFWISTPDYLEASGTGWNYGVELTMERFLNEGFYYLFTASLFESKYKDAVGRVLNTAFNNNFVLNLLTGKEFQIGTQNEGKRRSLDFNIKTTWTGGKRSTPFTPVLIDNEYKRSLDYNDVFAIRLKDYFTTNFTSSFQIDGNNITQEWGIEITNLFNTQNIFNENYNRQTGEKYYTYQLGMMVIPQYRIIF